MGWADDLRYSAAAVELARVAFNVGGSDGLDAVAVLAEFTPAERRIIGDRAILHGANPRVIAQLIAMVDGETVEVSGDAPKRRLTPIMIGVALSGLGLIVLALKAAKRGV